MNQQASEPPGDQALSALLGDWRVDTALPPRFQEAVWRRIASTPRHTGHWERFLQSISAQWDHLVGRPVGVAAVLVLLTATGAGFGLWHAQTITLSAQSAWHDAYLQAVSPTTVSLSP